MVQNVWVPALRLRAAVRLLERDAEGLTQEFFAKFLKENCLESLSNERGRFCAFLLALLKHFLADARAFASAQRWDARVAISLDAKEAAERFRAIPAETRCASCGAFFRGKSARGL